MLDEILEERVVSSRGLHRPRGVRRQRSDYPNRKRGSIESAPPIDYQTAIVILKPPDDESPPQETDPLRDEAMEREFCYA